jgi:hypothetical protein
MAEYHPDAPHHHHRSVKDHQVLVQIGPNELAPYAEGVVKPSHVIVLWVLFAMVWAVSVGLLIWFIILFVRESAYYCPDALTDTSGIFTVYAKRAAEPYSGPPSSVSTEVLDVGACETLCTNDSDCLFFTYNAGLGHCYFYNSGILPQQNILASVPGPTTLFSYVYVKKNAKLVQLRGALRNDTF